MPKAKVRLKRLDTYSVVVTLIIVLVLGSVAYWMAWLYTGRTTTVTTPPNLTHICNCPMIPAGTNPADVCKC